MPARWAWRQARCAPGAPLGRRSSGRPPRPRAADACLCALRAAADADEEEDGSAALGALQAALQDQQRRLSVACAQTAEFASASPIALAPTARAGARGLPAAAARAIAARYALLCCATHRAPERCPLLCAPPFRASRPPHRAPDARHGAPIRSVEGGGSQGADEPGSARTVSAPPFRTLRSALRALNLLTLHAQLLSLAAAIESKPDAAAMVQRMVARVRRNARQDLDTRSFWLKP